MALLDSLSAQGGAAQSTGYVPLSGGGLLQQLVNQYGQQQAQDAAATGQLAGMLKQMDASGAGPNALSADGQALAQKFLAGNASRKDKLQLMGEAQTALAMQQAKAKIAQDQSGANVNNAQAGVFNAQGNMMAGKWAMLQQLMGQQPQGAPAQAPQPAQGQPQAPAMAPTGAQSTPNIPAYLQPNQQPPAPAPNPGMLQAMAGGPSPVQGGTGQPVAPGQPSVRMPPPAPLTINSPQFQAQYPQILRMTMGDTDKASQILQDQVASANKQQQAAWQAKADATSPTGNLYFNGYEYKDGIPVSDKYSPEVLKGAGTTAESKTAGAGDIVIPHGGKAPGPVIFRGNGQPDTAAGTAGYNTDDPEWQKDTREAFNQALASSTNLSKSKLLVDAAEAYTTGNTTRLNALMQLPGAQELRQGISGVNPANAFKIALSANTQSILAQIKSPNGSMGGRILQNEYENTANILGNEKMDNPTIRTAAANLYTLNDRQNSIDQAYAKYRQVMPAGKAEALVYKQFGSPPKLLVPSPRPPQAAIMALQAFPQAKSDFESKYTGWRASDFGVK